MPIQNKILFFVRAINYQDFCEGNKLSRFLTVLVLEENESRFATAIQQVVDLPILDKSKENFKGFKMFIIVLA